MDNKLLTRFAENHPETVATLLADKSVPDIASYLGALPASQHGKILAALPSSRLAECMTLMSAEIVASALMLGEQRETLCLIAHLPNKRYQEIVDAGGDNRELLSKRLFAHSEKTLGSIADARFITVRQRTVVSVLKAQLENMQTLEDQPIYLVGNDGALVGRVPLMPLFSFANQSMLVDSLADTVDPLPASLEIAAALDARQWEQTNTIPIVNDRNELIGTINKEQLADHEYQTDYHSLEDVVGELMLGYIDVGAKLLSITLGEDRDGIR
tara:strand:+ start:8753 stop:9565 length:813 start_codon:yes stop_codon:yes gene_type:complete